MCRSCAGSPAPKDLLRRRRSPLPSGWPHRQPLRCLAQSPRRSRRQSPTSENLPFADSDRDAPRGACATLLRRHPAARQVCCGRSSSNACQNSSSDWRRSSEIRGRKIVIARSARSGRVAKSGMPFSMIGRVGLEHLFFLVGVKPFGCISRPGYDAAKRIGEPVWQAREVVECQHPVVGRADHQVSIIARCCPRQCFVWVNQQSAAAS